MITIGLKSEISAAGFFSKKCGAHAKFSGSQRALAQLIWCVHNPHSWCNKCPNHWGTAKHTLNKF